MGTHVVTGVAGFIGSHLADRLLATGEQVVGVDAFAAGYDPVLQHARVARLRGRDGFTLHEVDVADEVALEAVLPDRVDTVVHLAARAGVRASTDEPRAFVRANVLGFTNVLEAARARAVSHLLYASSSSVYGGLAKVPWAPEDPVDHPVSVYAATKRADELLAHTYAHLHGLPATGLRFFTVHGPWGRPDMAYWRFAQAILTGERIELYGDGSAVRDFTYVDDVVDALVALLDRPPAGDPTWSAAAPDPATSLAPHRLHNVGHGGQASVLELVGLLEAALGETARIEFLPPRAGDVPRTWSDSTSLRREVGDAPATSLADGVERFVAWFRPWFEAHGPVR